jgi:hypothetical protein
MTEKQLHWEDSTIDPIYFQIEDVNNDNACFYRSMANSFNQSTSLRDINSIKKLKKYGTYKPLADVYQHSEWGYSGEKQDTLARFIQEKTRQWIYKNRLVEQKEYGMDMGTMVLLTHMVDMDSYMDRYHYFAGDTIIDEYDTGKLYKSGKRVGQPIFKKCALEERWGGIPEHIAISEMYKIPILIITTQKYDDKRDKIMTGKIRNNKTEKGVRFKIIQVVGRKYIGKSPPLFTLWKNHNKQGHYMSLYLKDIHMLETILKIH